MPEGASVLEIDMILVIGEPYQDSNHKGVFEAACGVRAQSVGHELDEEYFSSHFTILSMRNIPSITALYTGATNSLESLALHASPFPPLPFFTSCAAQVLFYYGPLRLRPDI